MVATRQYVYGVVNPGAPLPPQLTGLYGMPVAAATVDRLAALVSPIEVDSVRPERRHLMAHQGVLTRAASSTDVLPMAFGMISDDENSVRDLLAEHATVLRRELGRIAGRVEMTVRLRWQGEDVFRSFVARYPELRRRRDACFDGQREPSQMELLELGRQFEQLLTREREEKTNLALVMLGQVAVELKNVQPTNERLMFEINCLVNRGAEPKFEAAVEELAGKFSDEFVIEMNGPWPPYNFVNVNL